MGVLTFCVLVRPFVSLIAKREVIKIEKKSKIEEIEEIEEIRINAKLML